VGLNYIWDLVIKADWSGLERKDLTFAAAKVFSPYMELSPEALNAAVVERRVEVNPYYRFYDIFRDLFDVNNHEEVELRNTLFDIAIHLLAELDVMQGMNKQEYYIRFVLRDLEAGLFGSRVKEGLVLFNREEQEIIAANVLRLYETGEALYLLRDTMRKLFKQSTLYANCEEKEELLFYIGKEETKAVRAKVELVRELFLPARFHTELYWSDHFGIIGVEETMKQDHIALY
jgi:hypothetical protein